MSSHLGLFSPNNVRKPLNFCAILRVNMSHCPKSQEYHQKDKKIPIVFMKVHGVILHLTLWLHPQATQADCLGFGLPVFTIVNALLLRYFFSTLDFAWPLKCHKTILINQSAAIPAALPRNSQLPSLCWFIKTTGHQRNLASSSPPVWPLKYFFNAFLAKWNILGVFLVNMVLIQKSMNVKIWLWMGSG